MCATLRKGLRREGTLFSEETVDINERKYTFPHASNIHRVENLTVDETVLVGTKSKRMILFNRRRISNIVLFRITFAVT